ncbi:MAG: hypothetical protein IPJ37_14910 [Bacteroidales bacterium]|nr:hypothetical protein [Bacteroidales bacterium]
MDGTDRKSVEELQVVQVYEEFRKTTLEMRQVWRAAKRRNITSSQWAVAAMKARPMMDEILSQNQSRKGREVTKATKMPGKEKQMVESIPPSDSKEERDESRRSKVQFVKGVTPIPSILRRQKH